MKNQRVQDWSIRLPAYIEERRALPFAWGEQDCCQFARGAVVAVTGWDPASDWGLRAYRSPRGGLAQLARLGGVAALPLRAGFLDVPVLLAQRGDLALLDNAGDPALGVVLGDSAAFAGKQGLEFVPVAQCSRAWRVG